MISLSSIRSLFNHAGSARQPAVWQDGYGVALDANDGATRGDTSSRLKQRPSPCAVSTGPRYRLGHGCIDGKSPFLESYELRWASAA